MGNEEIERKNPEKAATNSGSNQNLAQPVGIALNPSLRGDKKADQVYFKRKYFSSERQARFLPGIRPQKSIRDMNTDAPRRQIQPLHQFLNNNRH